VSDVGWQAVPDLYSAKVGYPGMNLQVAATLDGDLVAVWPSPVHGARHDAHAFAASALAGLLADFVSGAADSEPTAGLGIGLFGASTGAVAALIAAANRPNTVQAVVSRGGRPDPADAHLPKVGKPTLLIVGERDPIVIDLNRKATQKMDVETRLEIIPGATRLFEEPGTLEQVAHLARDWFLRHLQLLLRGENVG
jgi:putative phosphoribosyl transferase